jgi:hypothetical protein
MMSNAYTDKAKQDDDGRWVKHTDFHWSRVLNEKRLDYWPSKSKFMYNGKVTQSDVIQFIRANSDE